MTINEIRERAIENLMLHKGFDRGPCEHIVDIVFNTEIVPERKKICSKCSGDGKRRILGFPHDKISEEEPCMKCNGLGSKVLPPVTVEQAILDKLSGRG